MHPKRESTCRLWKRGIIMQGTFASSFDCFSVSPPVYVLVPSSILLCLELQEHLELSQVGHMKMQSILAYNLLKPSIHYYHFVWKCAGGIRLISKPFLPGLSPCHCNYSMCFFMTGVHFSCRAVYWWVSWPKSVAQRGYSPTLLRRPVRMNARETRMHLCFILWVPA